MSKYFKYDIYLLCPVRNATESEEKFLTEYKSRAHELGFNLLYPATDTKQKDLEGGYNICMDHAEEILNSRASHIYWNQTSTGSHVDLGSLILEHKRRKMDILLVNRDYVEKLVQEQLSKGIEKSYERVLLRLDDIADDSTRIYKDGSWISFEREDKIFNFTNNFLESNGGRFSYRDDIPGSGLGGDCSIYTKGANFSKEGLILTKYSKAYDDGSGKEDVLEITEKRFMRKKQLLFQFINGKCTSYNPGEWEEKLFAFNKL